MDTSFFRVYNTTLHQWILKLIDVLWDMNIEQNCAQKTLFTHKVLETVLRSWSQFDKSQWESMIYASISVIARNMHLFAIVQKLNKNNKLFPNMYHKIQSNPCSQFQTSVDRYERIRLSQCEFIRTEFCRYIYPRIIDLVFCYQPRENLDIEIFMETLEKTIFDFFQQRQTQSLGEVYDIFLTKFLIFISPLNPVIKPQLIGMLQSIAPVNDVVKCVSVCETMRQSELNNRNTSKQP